MIKPIVKDLLFLRQKSEAAIKDDMQVATDLQDTLTAHRDACVGMDANMIGYKKRIIIVSMGFVDLIMINLELISQSELYETKEGCLSSEGKRKNNNWRISKLKKENFRLRDIK